MEDLGFKGKMHTWSNIRRGKDQIVEQLDRFLGNLGWGQRFPKAQCINEVTIDSDHSPVELILDYSDAKGRRRFRFENLWLERQDRFDLIKWAWQRTNSARAIQDLEPKLNECKRSLIEWSRRTFKHNVLEINKAKQTLKSMGKGTLSEDEQGEERALKSRIDTLWKQEEIYWRQRSRVTWLKEGDRNTRFFHLSTVARRKGIRLFD